MIVTKSWIHAHSSKGAWNRKQIEALGLTWPATKGWQKRLEGTEISETAKMVFEHRAGAVQDKPTYSDLLGEIRGLKAANIRLRK